MSELQHLIDSHSRIVFFGGAGVSTESGIPDYRSRDGLYNRGYTIPAETLLSHSYFEGHTEEFFEFYRNVMLYPDAKPNAAHRKLAELEKAGKLLAVITQNIDGLHQKAGSKRVYELHGSVHRNYCMRCGKSFELSAIINSKGVPKCGCGGTIKPDVVLYEEGLDDVTVSGAVNAMANADMVIIGGTSLNVYPAAGLLNYFSGDATVVINMQPTPMDRRADLVIDRPIGEVMSELTVKP